MIKFLHIDSTFNTGLTAPESGQYDLRLRFNGQIFSLSESISEGNAIEFDVSVLNEDYVYTCIELQYPDGTIEPLEPIQIRISL